MSARGYAADLDSAQRIMAEAPPDKCVAVFKLICKEHLRWVEAGDLQKPDVVDNLRQIGLAAELSESEIQSALAEGIAQPFDPSKTQPPTTPKFRLVPFEQLTPGDEPSYLVKGLIPRVGMTVAWGPPKCGKSFWAFDLAMHVALDLPYRERRVQGGAVVYCAFEGASGFKARAEAYRLRYLSEHTEPVPFFLSPSPIDLTNDHPALIASIQSYLAGAKPALVVLDTLNRSLNGSESDDKDMTRYIKATDAIRDAFDCAVLVVHHCGIDATRPRGHTALAGAVDAQLAVKRDAGDNVVVTVERMKDGAEGDSITSALDPVDVGTDSEGDTISSCVIVPAEPGDASGPRPSGATKVAFDLLRKAIDDDPQPTPTSNHIPPKSRTTTLVRWRKYCDAGTVTSTDTPDAKRKAFVRAVGKLQTQGHIGVWNDYVWLSGHAGH